MRSMHISACTAGTPESSGFGRFMLPLRRNSLGRRSMLAVLLLDAELGAAPAAEGAEEEASALCKARYQQGSHLVSEVKLLDSEA